MIERTFKREVNPKEHVRGPDDDRKGFKVRDIYYVGKNKRKIIGAQVSLKDRTVSNKQTKQETKQGAADRASR